MNTESPKKLLIINILDILRKYSDASHRLSLTEIIGILEKEYGMKADRKAVRRNILNLKDFGYEIEYSEKSRMTPVVDKNTKEVTGVSENFILYDFYLRRSFDDSELRLLIDSLLFSRHIPYNQCKALVKKLEGLSNVYFSSKLRHIARMPEDKTDNKQIFFNIDLLDESIREQRKVVFKYTEYGLDKKIHIKKRPDGSEREYLVSPYQMAAREGKYYLICNYDKYDDISNYRIDRIRELKITDAYVKPFETLQWSNGRRLDLAEYMKEHVYMYAGENADVKFRITKPMISDVIDMFGSDVRFLDEDENGVTVSAHINLMSMEQFAKSYAPDVVVLKPQELADKIKLSMEETVQKYNEMKG